MSLIFREYSIVPRGNILSYQTAPYGILSHCIIVGRMEDCARQNWKCERNYTAFRGWFPYERAVVACLGYDTQVW